MGDWVFRKVFPNTLESRNGKLDPTYEERKSMNMKTSFNKVKCNSFKGVLLLRIKGLKDLNSGLKLKED